MSSIYSVGSQQISAYSALAADRDQFEKLKGVASSQSSEGIRAVAKQFEAIFVGMMLKSMRDAIPKDEAGSTTHQSELFTAMLDQQLSQALTSQGGLGLARMIEIQLGFAANVDLAAKSPTIVSINAAVSDKPPQIRSLKSTSMFDNRPSAQLRSLDDSRADDDRIINLGEKYESSFSDKFVPAIERTLQDRITTFKAVTGRAAVKASRISGIPTAYILAQAALESGWGRAEVIGTDGKRSHNLFGIKAMGGWKGKVAEAMTTEFIDGVSKKMRQAFRAYNSYTDSFIDFANLLKNSTRYQPVLKNLHDPVAYGRAMQDAGYATDPDYAKKLTNIIYMFIKPVDDKSTRAPKHVSPNP
jgi:flagellar protein FlgJ